MTILGGAVLILGGFLAGSVPWGVVIGRAAAGIDLREHGSKSTGATNALRVLGWQVSAAVLGLDYLKGLLPVLVGRWAGADHWMLGLTGVAAVAGHCWSPWISFRGGKGVATSFGAAMGLVPWLVMLAPILIGVVWLTRYVSLGSVVAAIVGSAAVVAVAAFGRLDWVLMVAITSMGAIVLAKHHSNIQRLLSGTERRFGDRSRPR